MVEQVTSLPQRGLGGMTYFEMSSKLKRILLDDMDRLWGEWIIRDAGRTSFGEAIELLEFLDPNEGIWMTGPVSDDGVGGREGKGG